MTRRCFRWRHDGDLLVPSGHRPGRSLREQHWRRLCAGPSVVARSGHAHGARQGRAAPHRSEERVARGKAARREVPRESHADFTPGALRRDPVELLESQAATRVPELVPIRYGRMLVSPFTFYRGAALIMAADLAGTPRSGITTQVCGDAHLMNFGVFASPERRLVFGINDFDETHPGPWEWDVKRLAASFAIAGRDNGYSDQGAQEGPPDRCSRAYRDAMRDLRRHDQPGRVVRAPRRRPTPIAAPRPRRRQRRSQTSRGQHRQGPHPRQHAGLRQAHPRRRRRAPDHQRPAAHPAHRGALRGRRARAVHGLDARRAARLPAAPCRATAGTCSRTSGWPTSPARSSASAASAPGPGSCCCSAATTTTRCSSRPRRPRRRCSRSSSARRSPRVARRTCGARPAPHAGGERHLPRLRARRRARRRGPRLLRAPAPRLEGLRDGRDDDAQRPWPSTVAGAAGRSLGPTPAPATASPSRPYLGGGDAFDRAIAEFSEAYADQNERDYDALVQAEKDGRITVERGL